MYEKADYDLFYCKHETSYEFSQLSRTDVLVSCAYVRYYNMYIGCQAFCFQLAVVGTYRHAITSQLVFRFETRKC